MAGKKPKVSIRFRTPDEVIGPAYVIIYTQIMSWQPGEDYVRIGTVCGKTLAEAEAELKQIHCVLSSSLIDWREFPDVATHSMRSVNIDSVPGRLVKANLKNYR